MGLAIALALRRLRAWHRVTWHKLTSRWPRYKHQPMDGGRECTGGEMTTSLRLIKSWQRKDNAAPEPDYGSKRRQP